MLSTSSSRGEKVWIATFSAGALVLTVTLIALVALRVRGPIGFWCGTAACAAALVCLAAARKPRDGERADAAAQASWRRQADASHDLEIGDDD